MEPIPMAVEVEGASEVEEVSHHQLEVDKELPHLPPATASTAIIAEADISEAGAFMSIQAYGQTRDRPDLGGPVGRGWRYDG
jgi:hypothetical protein